jgi:hypothetical protein
MGILRSEFDLTGTVVNGCILGEPGIDEETGEMLWVHPDLPSGDIEPDPWAEF